MVRRDGGRSGSAAETGGRRYAEGLAGKQADEQSEEHWYGVAGGRLSDDN